VVSTQSTTRYGNPVFFFFFFFELTIYLLKQQSDNISKNERKEQIKELLIKH
jgi:hypothetical protein